ncbi:hypothetical protein GIB67_003425 [Kingdonia uniflora]|uniref:Uncharacterized protein n=1 Tax=Kingdonia uniflora TaxID=39325 RepID=A0A7J7P938_9MAGN|nr:hypothetical protein GIB67_003425 [Kingdonia uniflora]
MKRSPFVYCLSVENHSCSRICDSKLKFFQLRILHAQGYLIQSSSLCESKARQFCSNWNLPEMLSLKQPIKCNLSLHNLEYLRQLGLPIGSSMSYLRMQKSSDSPSVIVVVAVGCQVNHTLLRLMEL